MEMIIIASLKKILCNNYTYLILIILFLYKGLFICLFSNIKYYTSKQKCDVTEKNILKNRVVQLEKEINELTDMKIYNGANYDFTKISFINLDDKTFYIKGGYDRDYKNGLLLINEDGLVGIIKDVYKDYSKCLVTSESNISVEVNNNYGTITGIKDDLLIISNISNYDDIDLNDEVYTSTLGSIKDKIYVGKVNKISSLATEKIIYVKSNVDIKDVNYLYVVGKS